MHFLCFTYTLAQISVKTVCVCLCVCVCVCVCACVCVCQQDIIVIQFVINHRCRLVAPPVWIGEAPEER